MWTIEEKKLIEKFEFMIKEEMIKKEEFLKIIDVASILKKEKLKNKKITEEMILSVIISGCVWQDDEQSEKIKKECQEHVLTVAKSISQKDNMELKEKVKMQKCMLGKEEDVKIVNLANEFSKMKRKGMKNEKMNLEEKWHYLTMIQMGRYIFKDGIGFLNEMEEIYEKINEND